MPLAAPVTRQTLSLSFMMIQSMWEGVGARWCSGGAPPARASIVCRGERVRVDLFGAGRAAARAEVEDVHPGRGRRSMHPARVLERRGGIGGPGSPVLEH